MLTTAAVKAARAKARPYKLPDEAGLYLHVSVVGSKAWRLRLRSGGIDRSIGLGHWPEVDLATARERRDEARGQPGSGAWSNNSAAITFEAAARAWHAQMLPRWSPGHADEVLASLERHVFPALGPLVPAAIGTPAVLRMLRAVEAAGPIVTARRVAQRVAAVFAQLVAEGALTANPAATVAKALRPPPEVEHQAALLDPDAVRDAYAAVAAAPGPAAARLASRFLALTVPRWTAVRGARWDELEDLEPRYGVSRGEPVRIDRPTWRIPAARMKLRRSRKASAANDHIIPLSHQAVAILAAARAAAGDSALIFPTRGGAPLGERAVLDHHARAGLAGRHSPHGWRAAFSTILNEENPADRAAIDLALAHAPSGAVEAAYNRAEHLPRRRELMQIWADLICGGSAATE